MSLKVLQDVTYARVDVADAFTSRTTTQLKIDGSVLLGGLSHARLQNLSISNRNYTGCLNYVVLNEVNVLNRLKKKGLALEFTCSDESKLDMIDFDLSSSSVRFPNPVSTDVNLDLKFRTYHQDGVLITNEIADQRSPGANNHNNKETTFFTLYFEQNILKLRLNSNIVLSMGSLEDIDFGSWHRIRLLINQSTANVVFNTEIRSYTFAQQKARQFGAVVSLGSRVETIPNFLGLIWKISIDNKQVRYSNATMLTAVRIGVYTMKDTCFPNPCNNSGRCIQTHNASQCDCTATGYRGATCSEKMPVYARTCLEYYKQGQTQNGAYIIRPGSEAFQVYCQMDHKDGPATLITHDRQRQRAAVYESTTSNNRFYYQVISYGIPMQQLAALTQTSQRCQQYVKYTCSSSTLMFSNNKEAGLINRYGVRWYSRDGLIQSYWGGATKDSYSCACGMNNSCADNRLACNCDILDNTWRSDSGYLRYKDDLPVTKLQFSKRYTNPAAEYIIGSLECFGNHTAKRSIEASTTERASHTTEKPTFQKPSLPTISTGAIHQTTPKTYPTTTTLNSFEVTTLPATTEAPKRTPSKKKPLQRFTTTLKLKRNTMESTSTPQRIQELPATRRLSSEPNTTAAVFTTTTETTNGARITRNPSYANTGGSLSAEIATRPKTVTRNRARIIVVHKPGKQSESALSSHQMFILIALISSLTLFTILLIVAVLRQRLFSCSSKKLTVELKKDIENQNEYAIQLPNNNTGLFSDTHSQSRSLSDINRIEIIRVGHPLSRPVPSESGSSVNSFDTSRYLEVGDESDSGSWTSFSKPKSILKANKFIFTSRPRSEGNDFEVNGASEVIGMIHVNSKPACTVSDEQTTLLARSEEEGEDVQFHLHSQNSSSVYYHRHSSDCAQRQSIDADTGFITDSSISGNSRKSLSSSGSDESNDECYTSNKDKSLHRSSKRSVRFSLNEMKHDSKVDSLHTSMYSECDDEVFS